MLAPQTLFMSLFKSNLHEIVPHLYIGNSFDASNKAVLKKHVRKLAMWAEHLGSPGRSSRALASAPTCTFSYSLKDFQYKRLMIEDTNYENIRKHFEAGNAYATAFSVDLFRSALMKTKMCLYTGTIVPQML